MNTVFKASIVDYSLNSVPISAPPPPLAFPFSVSSQFSSYPAPHPSLLLPFLSLPPSLPLSSPFPSSLFPLPSPLLQINKLRHVLVAFSWYDSNVGYCQGLNRLAAIALLFLGEEDSFWCLVAIVQCLLPEDYYSQTLLGSQTDQRVLKNLLDDRWHKLSSHLSSCEYVRIICIVN